jgi:hypothetical protein
MKQPFQPKRKLKNLIKTTNKRTTMTTKKNRSMRKDQKLVVIREGER